MLPYVVRSLVSRWKRNISLVCGLSVSLSVVLFAYALAYNLEAPIASAIAYATDDTSIWIIGSSGVEYDTEARALFSRGPLPPGTWSALKADDSMHWRRISATKEDVSGMAAIVYRSGTPSSENVAMPSSDLRARLGSQDTITVDGRSYRIGQVAADLPGLSVNLPWNVADNSDTQNAPAWVVGSPKDPLDWANTFAAKHDLLVVDLLDLSAAASKQAQIIVLKGSLSRFSPFSFQARTSAANLNRANLSLLGLLAIGVFGIGVWFAIASALLNVDERADELGVMVVSGFEAEFTIISLLEAAAVTVCAVPLAAVIAGSLLLILAGLHDTVHGLLGALPATLFFVPVSLAVSALFAAQRVAGRKDLQLIRGDRAL